MILQQRQADVLSIGQNRSIDVTFDKSKVQKLLYVLINLYSNPIATIVREYTSNGYDAHAEIGNKTDAVIVQIDQSMIRFTDFGAGMSQDKFEAIFCKILNSSKENTNDAIGCWGLGSKSAFAYVDSFTVVSRYLGTEKTWSLSKTADNAIAADLISTTKTNDRSGTTVNIPIKSGDKDRFIQEAQRQLRYFDNVYHDYDGAPRDIKLLKTKDVIISNQKMSLHKDKYGYTREDSNVTICLGQVNYPIDWKFLGISEVRGNLALYFNIGELNVTPSREGILWDDTARDKVLAKLEAARQYIKDKYITTVQGTKDIIKYVIKKDDTPVLELNGQTFNVNQFIDANTWSSNRVPGLRYDGRFDVGKLKDVPMFQDDTNKMATTPYSGNKVSFRKDYFSLRSVELDNVMFCKKFSRPKALYEYENNGTKYYLQVHPNYHSIVDSWVTAYYGGWLDDIEVPKTAYTKTPSLGRPSRAKDEIVVSVGKKSDTGRSIITYDKFNLTETDIVNQFSIGDAKYFIGTPTDKAELEKAFVLGFGVIQVAKSNLKYFNKITNVSPIHTLDSDKEVKHMVSMYANAARFKLSDDAAIIFSAAWHAKNNSYIGKMISKTDITYMQDMFAESNRLWNSMRHNRYGSKDMALSYLNTLKQRGKVEYDPKIDRMVDKYQHLTNLRHLNFYTAINNWGYLANKSASNYVSQQAWNFFAEYDRLYKKCN